MDMQKKLVQKVCGLFPSSFTSCQLRAIPDVAQTSINTKSLHGPKCPTPIPSSSSTGWFTSTDDVKARPDDLSISSNSGDSFRLRRTCAEMKTIDEKGLNTWPEHQLGSDFASTQLYYHSRSGKKRRRKKRKSMGEIYAVEKRSSDPHSDFRASMVEMIVEKQIFGAEGLENLLLSFLSLNHASYHPIIYHVFSDICQTLFTNS